MAKSKQVLEIASLNLGHRRPVSPNQSRINQNFSAVGQAWEALTPVERAAWQAYANQITHETGLRTAAGLRQKRPMNAFQAFASLNATLLACGQDMTTSAPPTPVKPAPVPPVLLTASTAPSASETTTLPFTLTLTVPTYSDILQVYAAAPRLAGQYPADKNAVIIGVFPAPFPDVLDLAPAYNARFGHLQIGQQVTLTVVPVSQQGLKGNPLTIAANVSAHAAVAQRQGDPSRALKAA